MTRGVDGVHGQVDALDAVTLLTGLDPFAAGARSGRGAGAGAAVPVVVRAAPGAAGGRGRLVPDLRGAAGRPAGGLLAGQILLAAASPEELDTPPRGV